MRTDVEEVVERKIISYHIITDHEFIHHLVSPDCDCCPEVFEGTNVYSHQRKLRNGRSKASKYRTYKLHEDGSWDIVQPDEVPWGRIDKE